MSKNRLKDKKDMSNAKLVAQNTFYQFAGKLVTVVSTIITTLLITRFFGAEGYGIFNLIANYPAVFFIIADFGMNAVAARELSIDDSKMPEMIGKVAVLRMLLSVVLIIAAGIPLIFLPYPPALKAGLFAGLLVLLSKSLVSTTNIVFQVRLRYDLANYANIMGGILFVLMTFGFAFVARKWGFGLEGISLVYILADLIVLGLSILFLGRLSVFVKPSLDWKFIKSFFPLCFPLGLMFIFSQINFKADSILLSFLKLPDHLGQSNIAALGVYSLPYKVFEVSLTIPTFFMNSAYPIMVRKYHEGIKTLLRTFKKIMMLLLASGLVVAVLGFLLSPLIIQILGGSEFYGSVAVLRILFAFIFIFFLTQPIAWLIVTLNGQKKLPVIYLCASVLNVLLNLYFIPRYSYYASAMITWMSELVILAFLAVTAYRLVKKI